ncbi:Uncharacterised protein [Vibrio cholerae]|nr:Uncharacterised protein [Vibrio cholerae]
MLSLLLEHDAQTVFGCKLQNLLSLCDQLLLLLLVGIGLGNPQFYPASEPLLVLAQHLQ